MTTAKVRLYVPMLKRIIKLLSWISLCTLCRGETLLTFKSQHNTQIRMTRRGEFQGINIQSWRKKVIIDRFNIIRVRAWEILPPIDQAIPRFSMDNSINFVAIAPVEHVNESPRAPITWMSGRFTYNGASSCTQFLFVVVGVYIAGKREVKMGKID